MTATQETPFVRTKDGAILGIDQRRLQGLVPGRIAAEHVMPGDTLVAQGTRVVVQTTGEHRGNVVLSCLSAGGASIVIVREPKMLTRVVAVGAFDR